MSQTRVQRSFSGGELSPALGARADLQQYAAGAKTIRNFLVLKGGGVANRPGFGFIGAVKPPRLIPGYHDAVNAQAPTHYWRLNETSGTVALDSRPAAIHGTISGSPVQGVGTPVGLGLRFDGANDYVALPPSVTAAGATWSLVFWLRPLGPGSGPHPYLGLFVDNIGNAYGVHWDRTVKTVGAWAVGGQALASVQSLENTWVHVGVVVSAGAVTFVLNGVIRGSGTMNTTFTPGYLGGYTSTMQLHGELAEMAYWPGRALNLAEIQQLYNTGVNNGGGATLSSQPWLLRYIADDPQDSILIEGGYQAFRFWKQGAPIQVNIATVAAWSSATTYAAGDLVQSGGAVYNAKVASTNLAPASNPAYWHPLPVVGGGLFTYEVWVPYTVPVRWNQTGKLITLTHRDYAPAELIFLSLTRWVWQAVTIAPASPVPTAVTATAGTGGGAQPNQTGYAITAAAPGSFEESLAGLSNRITCAPPTILSPNLLDWTPMTYGGVQVQEYYVYRDTTKSNTYEFISTCKHNTNGPGGKVLFLDTGFIQDPALTPPINDFDLTSDQNRPRVSAFHQQRRFFAHTYAIPDAVWASKTGQRSNYSRSSPLQDDDALNFRIAQNQNHPVQHLVSVGSGLLVFSTAGEHRVISTEGPRGPLAPNSIVPIQDLYAGASDCVPVVIGDAAVFVQARGKVVRDVTYQQQIEGLAGRDLTLFSGHLFEKFTIPQLDYQQNDQSILWARRSDGTLLGLTYLREQNLYGWHRHDTRTAAGFGKFLDLCVVPEPGEDVLYAIVERVVNGATVRYIERLERRSIITYATDAIFLDASLSLLSGGPVSTLTGLSHLVGETVGVVANGVYLGAFPVSVSGTVTLPAAATPPIHAGLLYQSDLETLDLDVEGTDLRGHAKHVGQVSILVQDSNRQFHIGIDATTLTPYIPGEGDRPTVAEFTGLIADAPVISDHNYEGRVFLRQSTPLPLTVLAVLPRVVTEAA